MELKLELNSNASISPRGPEEFREGGGAEFSCPNIGSIACPTNQVVLPEYYLISFAQKMIFSKIIQGAKA